MPYGMLRKHQVLPIVSLACFTCLFLWACHPIHPTQAEPNSSSPTQSPDTMKRTVNPKPRSQPVSQILPITATAKLGNQTFNLEVARTASQQTLGLMYRTFLPSNQGMLFSFSPPQPVKFWMKHCRLSLDMIFLRQGKVIEIAANSPPCKSDPCPVYGPNEPIDQVIEIRGTQAASLGLKVGDTIKVEFLKTPQ
jgi:uncharacterized protein